MGAPSMFTLRQIDDIHTRLGSAKSLAEYVRSLQALGVDYYDSYLFDGHSEYFGQGGYKLASPPVHDPLIVVDVVQNEAFLHHLRQHELGRTKYLEMSRGLAEAGVEKWTVHTGNLTMTFYDKAGVPLLVKQI